MDMGEERKATDAGLTGDKIKAADPAAAPQHTDAEASGAPTSGQAARDNLRRLLAIAWTTPSPDAFGAWRQPRDEHQRRLGWILLSWTVLLSALGVLAGVISWP